MSLFLNIKRKHKNNFFILGNIKTWRIKWEANFPAKKNQINNELTNEYEKAHRDLLSL